MNHMAHGKTTGPTGRIEILIVGMAVFFLMIAGCAHQGAVTSQTSAATPPTESTIVIKPAAETVTDYAVGPGDILEISVWKDEALSRQVVVLPDGTINFPLVGRFSAGGKSVAQLKAEMEKKISRFVPEPDLTIIVQQVNSMVVYVVGKVNRPGHIPLNRNISVLQALSMAGGLNIFADPQDIRIVRKDKKGTMIIPFNYKAVTEDNMMEGNIQLQRGDVIVVK
jgi:polysaccharide export outer membrane protein